MSDDGSSTGHPKDGSVVSGEDVDLETALRQFTTTANCPQYLRTAFTAWEAQLR